MTKEPSYIHLLPEGNIPDIENRMPFAMVVIVEVDVSNDWRNEVSSWLVDKGCLYMMAWGKDCSLWDDSVDWANIEKFNFKDIPDDKFVMTSWHEDEFLEKAFWFAEYCADHPTVELSQVVILDIGNEFREDSILRRYRLTKEVSQEG